MDRRSNHYVWHRSSHFGPHWYDHAVRAMVLIGCLLITYGLTLGYFAGFWSGVLILWVMSPVLAGSYVGVSALRTGGLPALVGFVFLLGNFALSAGLYLGGKGIGPILLMGPFIHLVAIVGFGALLAAMGRKRR